jgi:hypothetical protein
MRYGQAFAVTESDTADFRPGFVSDALYIGGTGNLVVEMEDGKEATFLTVPVGIFPVACRKLKTASTVTGVVALKA